MRYLLSLLLILNQPIAHAKEPRKVPYLVIDPAHTFAISTSDYEDYRIDSNRDGLIDLWVLKKGSTTITLSFSGKEVKSLKIKTSKKNLISENYYAKSGGILSLEYSQLRQPLVMNGSDETCEQKTSSTLKELAKLSSNLTAVEIMGAAEDAIQCENEEHNTALNDSLSDVLLRDNFSSCIKSPKVVNAFSAGSKASLDYYSVKMKLDLQKIAHGVDGKKLIKCSPSESTNLSASYTEDDDINIKIPKGMSAKDLAKKVKPLLLHELLHRSGVVDETSMDKIISMCAGDAIPSISLKNLPAMPPSLDTSTPTAVQIGFGGVKKSQDTQAASDDTSVKKEVSSAKPVAKPVQQRKIASDASSTGGGAEGINIAKEVSVAEVKQAVPSADKLAINSVNMTDEGKTQAVADSQAQSAPVFAMADRAMGVMNTRALASDDASESSSTRSSSDRYQVRHQVYESDSSRTKSADNTDYSKMIYKPSRSGGTVVEEVDLTKRPSSVATSETAGRTTSANSRGIASTGSAASAIAQGGSDEVAGSSGGGGGFSSGSGGGGSGTFYADKGSGSTRKTNAENRRGVASQNTGSTVETSRDEVITFISNANYTQTKSKLREQSFQQTLSNNQISIIYADGSDPIGAQRGTTVFLDDGSRFIMQRRK